MRVKRNFFQKLYMELKYLGTSLEYGFLRCKWCNGRCYAFHGDEHSKCGSLSLRNKSDEAKE